MSVCECMCVCVSVCMHVCVHVYVCVCAHLCVVYIQTCIQAHACIFVFSVVSDIFPVDMAFFIAFFILLVWSIFCGGKMMVL